MPFPGRLVARGFATSADALQPEVSHRQGAPASKPKTRDGVLTLSDVRGPLVIVCKRCGRRGRYGVTRLVGSTPNSPISF